MSYRINEPACLFNDLADIPHSCLNPPAFAAFLNPERRCVWITVHLLLKLLAFLSFWDESTRAPGHGVTLVCTEDDSKTPRVMTSEVTCGFLLPSPHCT